MTFSKAHIYNLVVWTAGLALIALLLLLFESNLLWKVQELNLFQSTPLYFSQQLLQPGGMLVWLATYLTQYLYYPSLGVLLLSCCWLLLMWTTKRTFQLPARWALLTFVPVVLLLTTIVDMGYWIYILKLRGHFFLTTLGTLFVVVLLWAFRRLPSTYYLRAVWMVLASVVGYPLAGIYGLAATLLMGIFSWRLESRGRSVVYSVLALLTVVAVPLMAYRCLYYEINVANVYWAALPLFVVQDEYPLYYLPYYLLALFYLVLVATYQPEERASQQKRVRWMLAQVVLLAVLIGGAYEGWFKDENFHRELQMQHCVEQLDWEGVLESARQQKDEPTRSIVMMQNLALSRLGRQGDEMYYYKNGSKAYASPFPFRLLMVIGPMIYNQYGMTNFSARYSTEMGVEYGWRAEYLKNLTRSALLNGEWQLARKYIAQLMSTTFHQQWATQMAVLIGHRQQIAASPAFAPITHLMHYRSHLYGDQGFVERCIMEHLADLREVDDPYFQEQALLAATWSMNPEIFWYHFKNYVKQHPGQSVPLHYQEAIYLYGVLANHPDIDRFPVEQRVKENYARFDQAASRVAGMSLDDAREALEPYFGNTFFFQYHLMNKLAEY